MTRTAPSFVGALLGVSSLVGCAGGGLDREPRLDGGSDAGDARAGTTDVAAPDGGMLAECDDGDACTGRDHVEAGVCIGTPMTCDSPPPPKCVGATKLRTYASRGACTGGSCSYAYEDTICTGGCEGSNCRSSCTPIAWTTTIVDAVSGSIASMALDSLGGVHIIYLHWVGVDQPNRLRYAHRSPSGVWTVESVDDGEFGPFVSPSLAVDASGGVHGVYQESGGEDMYYIHRNASGSWVPRERFGSGRLPSIAVDSSRGVHVSYFVAAYGDNPLYYAYRRPDDGTWTSSEISGPLDAGYSSVAIDATGEVHVAYEGSVFGPLGHSHRESTGAWSVSHVDTNGGQPSLAIDASGGLHISYYFHSPDTTDSLRYASREPGGSWVTMLVDAARAPVGSSLAVDRFGGAHISYFDSESNELRYAYRPPSQAWTLVRIDSGTNDHSLAVDASGVVHISYRDNVTGALRHTYGRLCP